MVVIFAASLVGAYLPLSFKTSDRRVHLMIAFSAGIFLGVLFLMLLPEAIEESEAAGYDTHIVMYAILGGFLAIFIFDFLFRHYVKPECDCEECRDYHSHDMTSLSAFVGLSIHACFDGLALAAAFVAGEEVGLVVLLAICVHKIVEVFSLSSTFLLSNRRKKATRYLVPFCLITPLAGIASYLILNGADTDVAGIAIAISAGIFMFVTMIDILPEAFHRRDIDVKSVALLLIGLAVVIAIVAITEAVGGHAI
jgi:zinc transporter ZupT